MTRSSRGPGGVVLRLAPLLGVLLSEVFAISVDHERHSLLDPHVHGLNCIPGRRQSLDCVREVGPIADELVPIQRILLNTVPRAAPTDARLDLASGDI